MEKHIRVGIDPGKKGSLSWISLRAKTIRFFDWSDHVLDDFFVHAMMNRDQIQMIYIEDYLKFAGRSSTSMLTTARDWGKWERTIELLKVPYQVVNPQKWQRAHYGVPCGNKNMGEKRIKQLFPWIDPINELRGKKGGLMDGRTDSLLIATYDLRGMPLPNFKIEAKKKKGQDDVAQPLDW